MLGSFCFFSVARVVQGSWSRASLPFPFPGFFLFVDLRVFYRFFFFFTLRSIFHSAVVLLPIMAYDETTRKARPELQECNSCTVIGGGG